MPLQPCYRRVVSVNDVTQREEIALTTRDAQRLSQDASAAVTAASLLERLELERAGGVRPVAADPMRRAELGQFFTPAGVARFMAAMLDIPSPLKTLRILDAGAGCGTLTAAAVAELCARPVTRRPRSMHATLWEIDRSLAPELARTLSSCQVVCRDAGVAFTSELRQGNFLLDAAELVGDAALFTPKQSSRFDVAILNPPYRKLRTDSVERGRLDAAGIETSNLYSAFVWLALRLLEAGGELVAITPRSFTNGAYFRPFRRALAREFAFRRVHVYDARDVAFAGDDVLQENVIFHGVRGGAPSSIKVTTSFGPADDGLAERTIAANELMLPHDPDCVMHVVPDETDARIAVQMRGLSHTLADLDVTASTGRVVAFRLKDRLRERRADGDVPLIFPRHVARGYVAWPHASESKPNALTTTGPEDALLLPAGWYVLVNRFSAKEDKRRIVAALYDPSRIEAARVAFDNKLNVLHRRNAGLPEHLAKGLAVFLNCTAVDAYFRQFSGHTQVNAADLRSLRFPAPEELERLGRRIARTMPGQDEINQLVREEIPSMSEDGDPVVVKRRIQAAESILKALQAPKAQRNERSALTLLGLLDLAADAPWSAASAPLRGVTELMDWMAANYGKKYAPNTRETIRRFTLHQFVEMGLVILNPDDPTRPVNSPKNVYQIEADALELLRSFGTPDWEKAVETYVASAAGANRLREKARMMDTVPVTLPDGQTLALTPGGQNVLIKEVIERFAPTFTPGGHIIYVGDTGKKHLLFDEAYLRALGVEVDPHGKMPDVVIHYVERNWLILIEAVTSHGPVNALRHNQLKSLFAGSTAGLVFVTTFLNRAAMREYLPDIAWETEVWVADAPDHLIHFNGERFLGPYAP